MAEAENDPKHLLCDDAIGKVPDEVLQTILDKVSVIDAVSTGFLSRRWRDLWKHISIIEFNPSWVELTGKEIVASLNQFVSLHIGHKIQKFSVRFTYKPEMSTNVDSWILFAINKHVEDLDLDFDVADTHIIKNTANAPCYKLLPCVFNSKSLVRAVLCFCALELPVSFRLQSLKVLRLHRIELPHDAIQMVTSNAPVLQQLFLSDCNRTKDLRVHVAPNPRFCNLVIIENFFPVNHTTQMDIKAPTAFQVAFMGSMPRSKYRIEEVSECVKVHFNLQGMFTACGRYAINVLANEFKARKYENALLEFLTGFRDTDTFHMCNWCIQLLSLRELRNLKRLRFNCTVLEITSAFHKWELPGIIYMLKACHKIEELIILMSPRDDEIKIPEDYLLEYDFQESKFLDIQDLGQELENLRTVRFKSCHGDYQTWRNEYFDLKKFFHGAKLGIEITKLLRDHAVNLESIIFSTKKQHIEIFFEDEDENDEEEEEEEEASPPNRRKIKICLD
ncbi:hypothetical protein JCGZ_11590 [Jatropha curcas]|uniref:F-box domain-containing protein n=2 Tax=Jatropha curcas TaxID=180498 RepID=A0A067KHD9_JATCU|nr:putative F-box/LRR-repeat protein At5g02700 isoform X2 [Jatropha curcas]KDP31214.1 hypothetical protein JCGZ_11590 [Jatropha curcas]